MAREEAVSADLGKLVLFLADGTTLDIPLDHPRVTVGRRPTNDVCLPYPAVSAMHAAFITAPPGVIVVEDLGSTNGTFVNGKSTRRTLLSDGDRIDIGRQQFLYVTDASAVVPPQRRGARAAGGRPADVKAGATEFPPTDGSATGRGASSVKRPSALDAAQANLLDAPPGDHHPSAEPGSLPPRSDPPPSGPTLKVISGPNAGRMLALDKDETLIGRVGVQVITLRKATDGIRVLLVEGATAPHVNAKACPPEGLLLQPGDTIEVAGARIEYSIVETAGS